MARFIPGKSGSPSYVYGFISPTSTGAGYVNGFSSISAYTQSPALGTSVLGGNSITQNLVTNHVIALLNDGGNFYYLASLTSGLTLVGSPVNIGLSASFNNPEIHMSLDGSKVFIATGTDSNQCVVAEYNSANFVLTRTIPVGTNISHFSASPNNDKFIVISEAFLPPEQSIPQMQTFNQSFTQTSSNNITGLIQAQYDHLGRIWMAIDNAGAGIMVQENGQTYQQLLEAGATFDLPYSMNKPIIAFDSFRKRILVTAYFQGVLKTYSIDASYLIGG